MNKGSGRVVPLVVIGVSAVATSFISGAVFCVGALIGEHREYMRRGSEQKATVLRVLESNKDYRHMEVEVTSIGEVVLSGDIPTRQAYESLKEELVSVGGSEFADTCLSVIDMNSAQK